jgi:hypothetical protein
MSGIWDPVGQFHSEALRSLLLTMCFKLIRNIILRRPFIKHGNYKNYLFNVYQLKHIGSVEADFFWEIIPLHVTVSSVQNCFVLLLLPSILNVHSFALWWLINMSNLNLVLADMFCTGFFDAALQFEFYGLFLMASITSGNRGGNFHIRHFTFEHPPWYAWRLARLRRDYFL